MGFPNPDKQTMSVTYSAPTFDREACLLPIISFTNQKRALLYMHTHTHTHVPLFPQPFFFIRLVFFFLNSSLFSAQVYFYPSVHGRSQRNDEAWETCSSPWQLYSKPPLSKTCFSSAIYTFVPLILMSHLLSSVFRCFFPPNAIRCVFFPPMLPFQDPHLYTLPTPPSFLSPQERIELSFPLWTNGRAVVE